MICLTMNASCVKVRERAPMLMVWSEMGLSTIITKLLAKQRLTVAMRLVMIHVYGSLQILGILHVPIPI